MRSADVVIVGGGVIGASVAYHLAARGCTNVVVLDHNKQPGVGSTGKATGGFRAQFNSTINVQLSLLAREKLRRFNDEIGVDPGYRPSGYLFVAHSQHALEALQTAQQVQHAAGLHEARIVTKDEIRAINPAVEAGDLIGGVFCPTDGFIQPLQILHGYISAAQRLGVRFEYGCPALGFKINSSGRIKQVRTPSESIAAGCVVNAAGAWAGQVAQMATISLPVRPLRRHVAPTCPTEVLPHDMPMTIFAEDGFHLRTRDGRVLLLWPDTPHTSDPFDTTIDQQWIDAVVRKAHARIPSLRSIPIDRVACWTGLYEMSPDRHAILGPAPTIDNFYFANGSSGHGVMHAPALGHLLAEIILDGAAHTLDASALRPTRFDEAKPNVTSELL